MDNTEIEDEEQELAMLKIDSAWRQTLLIGTVILGILMAGYMVRVERRAAFAEKEFSVWLYENDLQEFVEFFFKEGTVFLIIVGHLFL